MDDTFTFNPQPGTIDNYLLTGTQGADPTISKLTWLVLGEDQAARSHRVEQLTAL